MCGLPSDIYPAPIYAPIVYRGVFHQSDAYVHKEQYYYSSTEYIRYTDKLQPGSIWVFQVPLQRKKYMVYHIAFYYDDSKLYPNHTAVQPVYEAGLG